MTEGLKSLRHYFSFVFIIIKTKSDNHIKTSKSKNAIKILLYLFISRFNDQWSRKYTIQMSERKTNCRSVRHNNYKRQQFASHRPTPQSLVRYGAIVLNVRRIFIDVAGLNFTFWKGKKELLTKITRIFASRWIEMFFV